MFLLELNWFAVATAWVVAFIAGAVWFGPKTFFPVWWKAMGRKEDEAAGSGNIAVVFGLTAIAGLAQAITVASIIHFVALTDPNFGAAQGLITGLLVGVGLAAASSLSHRLFAGHGMRVWLIEVGSDVLNIMLMGLIIGAWR